MRIEEMRFEMVLRRIALTLLREQAARLAAGRLVRGGTVEALDPDTVKRKGTAKPGVETGAMLAALESPATIQVTRRGLVIRLSGSVQQRWVLFNRGSRRQPARPVGGIEAASLERAAREIAAAAKEQLAAGMNRALGRP